MIKFKVGDRVITQNCKYWNNKLGTVDSLVEHEFYTIYMVVLDESDLRMGFKVDELKKL